MNTLTKSEDAGFEQFVRIRKMIIQGNDINPLNLHQALTFSLEWADAYKTTHCFERVGMSFDATATLAMARLEWVLRKGREELSGVIDENDFGVLCNTFQAEMAIPDDFRSMASALADDLGIDGDKYEQSSLAPLLDKLIGLSAIQQVALRDLVEQFWHGGRQEFDSVGDFLKANGIVCSSQKIS